MVKLYAFSEEDQAALREMLDPNAPIDELADVVMNARESREFWYARTKPKEAREALKRVDQSARSLLRALESLPIDLRNTYLYYCETEAHISLKTGDDVDIDLLGFVSALANAADSAVKFDSLIKAKKGKPPDVPRYLLALAVADALRDAGHTITSSENGVFVSVLSVCTPAAGYELEEIRHLARIVTSGRK